MRIRSCALAAGITAAASLALAGAVAAPAGAQDVTRVERALDTHDLEHEVAGAVDTYDGVVDAGGIEVVAPAADGAPAIADDGTAVYTAVAPRTDIAVQTTEDSTRLMSIMHGSSAPSTVEYEFPGTDLLQQDDGSIVITADGVHSIGVIAPAWALDANGDDLATRYEVRGSTLIQHIDHGGAAYPVVADPAVSSCKALVINPAVCAKFNRSEVTSIYNDWARHMPATTLLMRACLRVPHAAAKAVCAVLAFHASRFTSAVKDAHKAKKCVELKIPLIGSVVGTTSKVVSC